MLIIIYLKKVIVFIKLVYDSVKVISKIPG